MKEVVEWSYAKSPSRWAVAVANRLAMVTPLAVDLGWVASHGVYLERVALAYLWLLAAMHLLVFIGIEMQAPENRPKPAYPDGAATKFILNATALLGVACLAAAGVYWLAAAMLLTMLLGAMIRATLVSSWTIELRDDT